MKIEKKHWIIIAVVVILIALWYFFLRKKTTTTSKYAGVYGSFGNESGFDTQGKVNSLDANLPMIGRSSDESNMLDGGSGTGGGGGWTKSKHKIKGVTNI